MVGKEVRADYDLRLFRDPKIIPRSVEQGLFDSKEDYSGRIARYRADSVKKNVDMFYKIIYQSIMGGRILSLNGGNVHHPDVIHRAQRGIVEVEVKGYDRTFNGKVLCSDHQFRNYLDTLMNNIEDAEKKGNFDSFGFNYAFFSYASPTSNIRLKKTSSSGRVKYQKSRQTPLSTLSKKGFVQSLAQRTKDLLVVPSNVMSILMYGSASSSLTGKCGIENPAPYRAVRASHLSLLRKGIEGIDAIVADCAMRNYVPGVDGGYEGLSVFKLSDFLLDRLKMEKKESPRIILGKTAVVEPFPYTTYSFKSPKDVKQWNLFLRENKESLLENMVGISIGEGIPF